MPRRNFVSFYEMHFEHAVAGATWAGLDREQAKDVAQDVMMSILSRFDSLTWAGDPVQSERYVRRAACNRARNVWRKGTVELPDLLPTPPGLPEVRREHLQDVIADNPHLVEILDCFETDQPMSNRLRAWLFRNKARLRDRLK